MWFEIVMGSEKSFENALEHVLLEKSVKSTARGKRIRVSELARFCPRQLVLMHLLNITPQVKESVRRGLAFEMGTVMHEVFQKKVLPSFYLHGNWVSCDGNVIEGLKPQTAHHCGLYCWRYRELEFVYPLGSQWELVGHVDGLIMYQDRWLLLELKTMDGDYFKTLEQPLWDHVIQTQIYFYLIKQSKKYPHINTAKIVYINKDYGKRYRCQCGNVLDYHGRLFKSFSITYEEKVGEQYVQNARSIIQIYEKKIPNRLCLTTTQGLEQYKCPIVTQCFSDVLCASLQVNDEVIKSVEEQKG